MKVISKPVKIRFKLKRGGTVSFNGTRTFSKPEKVRLIPEAIHEPIFNNWTKNKQYRRRMFQKRFPLDRLPVPMLKLKSEYGHESYGHGERNRIIFKELIE